MCITTTCRNNYVALVDHFLQTYTNGNKIHYLTGTSDDILGT
jgi:hypothetical protein